MRNISFSITTEQFKARTKTVTRRIGWDFAKAGDIYMGCLKCMGLRRGQRYERLGQIRVLSVRNEPLERMILEPEYGKAECRLEGFPEMAPEEFVRMFCTHMRCRPQWIITRIEFEYL